MSRLVKTMVTSIICLLFIGAVAFVIFINVTGDNLKTGAQSIDQIIEHSFETPEITTDLKDGRFVRIQFQIVTDGKNATKEIAKRDFQLRNILIKELANMDSEEFKSGLDKLEEVVQEKLNEVMTEGNIVDVYTISKILQ